MKDFSTRIKETIATKASEALTKKDIVFIPCILFLFGEPEMAEELFLEDIKQ